MRLLLLTPLALALAGCLFTDDPQCFPGEERDRCALGERCVDRVCVPDPAAPDLRPDLDDGIPLDRGPTPSDSDPPDANDGSLPDVMLSPDMTPIEPCTPSAELCNALDDDCDRRVDEDTEDCDTYPDICVWADRGTHTYLICPIAESQGTAIQNCARIPSMRLAHTETCEEADWLGSVAEYVATERDRFDQRDLSGSIVGWWLDLRFGVADDLATLRRVSDNTRPATQCWNPREPNNLLFGANDGAGEQCVTLFRDPDQGAEFLYGWNDQLCTVDLGVRSGTICEFTCDNDVDRDNDGVGACADCDDLDPRAPLAAPSVTCPDDLPEVD